MYSLFLGKDEPIAVLQIPKCGTQTLGQYQLTAVDTSHWQCFRTRIAFVRDPLNRFHSSFRFCSQTGFIGTEHCRGNYEAYVDWALSDGLSDVHVKPQSEYLAEHCGMVANDLRRIDTMDDFIKTTLGIKTVERQNTTQKGAPVSDYRIDDIMDLYKHDIEIYNATS